MPPTSTALTKIGERYPALTEQGRQAFELIRENLEGESVSPFDLDWIKVPTGSTKHFELADGEAAKEVVGVIVAQRNGRAYFPDPFGQGENVPACFSDDGITGHGTPGGLCEDCEFAQFGTAKRADGEPARGQACTQRKQLWMLLPGHTLPTIVSVPPTSLRAVKRYLFALSKAGHAYWKVETKITLESKESSGYTHAVLRFELGDPIAPEVLELVEAYRASVQEGVA